MTRFVPKGIRGKMGPLLAAAMILTLGVESLADRQSIPLDGPWQFRPEGERQWRTVRVPAPWEEHEGITYDGRGVYRTTIPTPRFGSQERLLLDFDAIATWAQVRVNGDVVGSHLGGWTPIRFDVSECAARSRGGNLTIEITVDERVGHTSQGFLPVFAPHFGGIWQSARIVVVPQNWVDERFALAFGDVTRQRIHVELPLPGTLPGLTYSIHATVRERPRSKDDRGRSWTIRRDVPSVTRSELWHHQLKCTTWIEFNIPVERPVAWSPKQPQLYDVEITLHEHNNGGVGNDSRQVPPDHISLTAAFRDVSTAGRKLLLNGQPIQIRGILNWGYAPPRNAPSITEQDFRRELEFIRSLGFNTMKFCLWIPPRRYFQLCDEMGILAWVEYPTWHSQWTAEYHGRLQREFAEFFAYDRNHPSVILRSLTCETGSQADLRVIQALYDQCHAMVPSAVVEDDSSWIEWNRVHDFYDDHPYGNNDTWPATLKRLEQYIDEHGEKPLVLGEAIAADTWVSPRRWQEELLAQPRPFWLPRFLEDNARWIKVARSRDAGFSEEQLAADSKRYALLMRKFQIEVFRREIPTGGYVVSVIRDIPLCSMGLIDYSGQPKWSPDDWSWHGADMIVLRTSQEHRSFVGGRKVQLELLPRTARSSQPASIQWRVQATFAGKPLELEVTPTTDERYGKSASATVAVDLPRANAPVPLDVRAEFTAPGGIQAQNAWRLWVIPPVDNLSCAIQIHDSVQSETKNWLASVAPASRDGAPILVASRLDANLWRQVQGGAKLLWMVDGEVGSLPTRSVWFLRGGPWVARHPIWERFPRDAFVDLQAFDLSSPVVPDIPYLPHIRPMAMLWQNHDLDHTETQGLLFEARVGKGHLIVTSLPHARSPAGKYLLQLLVEHMSQGAATAPSWPQSMIDQVEDELRERRIDLSQYAWDFRIDPDNKGLALGWQRREWKEGERKCIQIGSSWEGQGYPSLDGWAWYALDITVPKDWNAAPGYLVFHGVDDYYDVYVNGKRVGGGGNIERRETAFEERTSHAIGNIKPGDRLHIVIRVYDWYGAGGVFRPVWLSTTPFRARRILR